MVLDSNLIFSFAWDWAWCFWHANMIMLANYLFAWLVILLLQGQYKSTLVCPVCKKVSITFDPFMYLSLPLPSTNSRSMTLTVVSADGSIQPSSYTISVSKFGKFEDLIRALSIACSLGMDETLLVAEVLYIHKIWICAVYVKCALIFLIWSLMSYVQVYNNRILRYLEEPADSLSLIRDGDRLVAYRIKKDSDNASLVVFMHQHLEE